MSVAGAKEEVTVTGESPVLDNKKQTTAVNVSLDELQNIPSARDPWVVMQSVPGIVMDRVNVGGSESGQQAGFMGKGAASGDTTWNVDGMPITDMSSLSSPFYFDFDMFQEMNVVTGGSDAEERDRRRADELHAPVRDEPVPRPVEDLLRGPGRCSR